jgi:hypothetical protein
MGDRLDRDRGREVVERRTRWLVWAESLIILGLLVWVSVEYVNNQYLQAWVARNFWVLGFLLNGTFAGLYAGVLVGYLISNYANRKSEEEDLLEKITRKNL